MVVWRASGAKRWSYIAERFNSQIPKGYMTSGIWLLLALPADENSICFLRNRAYKGFPPPAG